MTKTEQITRAERERFLTGHPERELGLVDAIDPAAYELEGDFSWTFDRLDTYTSGDEVIGEWGIFTIANRSEHGNRVHSIEKRIRHTRLPGNIQVFEWHVDSLLRTPDRKVYGTEHFCRDVWRPGAPVPQRDEYGVQPLSPEGMIRLGICAYAAEFEK